MATTQTNTISPIGGDIAIRAGRLARLVDGIDGVRIAPSGVHIDPVETGIDCRIPVTVNGNYIEVCHGCHGGQWCYFVTALKDGEWVDEYASTEAALVELVRSHG